MNLNGYWFSVLNKKAAIFIGGLLGGDSLKKHSNLEQIQNL